MQNKNEYQAELFGNRTAKKYRELRKWARKNRISCYRIYDRDIPEVPVSLDIYEFLPEYVTSPLECAKFLAEQNDRISSNDADIEKEIKSRTYAVLYLYERPYEKDEDEEDEWLNAMALKAAETLGTDPSHIIKKQRKKQKGLNQYEKNQNESGPKITGIVQEQGQLFKIDLTSYIDTGLFFDHRPLRSEIRQNANNKRVLNLFCYTGSFSVYASQGNASFVESVDMSNTYLNWAKENVELNGFCDRRKYVFTRGDCIQILKEKSEAVKKSIQSEEKKPLFDIIILDPPTFSNSKKTFNVLDINRDWPVLCADCINLLDKDGILYFSTNSTKLTFDEQLLRQKLPEGIEIKCIDRTAASIPKDFEGTKCHKLYKIVKI